MDVSVCLDTSLPISDLRRLAHRAETAGLHAVYVPDHFLEFREAWTVLMALATSTERVRLGTLVLAVTHRLPGVMREMARTAQELCAGRLILGVGAGWNQAEHAAVQVPFPNAGRRLDLLAQACRELRGLVEVPLLVGGGGERRTMQIAATYADIWHAWATPEEFIRKRRVLDTHCREAGRAPESVRRVTGADITGSPATTRLLTSYQADEFIATVPRQLTTDQMLAAIETLGESAKAMATPTAKP